MALVVQKYGGTSVASVDRIRKVADRILLSKEKHQHMVVVLSAMGNTTDTLKKMAAQLDEEPTGREWDMLASTGEQVSIALLAMALRQKGCDAISLTGWQAGIRTESTHSDARIEHIDPMPIRKHLEEGKVVVVAGYQGITKQGEITTLGRGGSDTSAVALAGALQADLCEILTDVDGVYTADPRLVPAAQMLPWISSEQMLLLAKRGAGVLHPRCVEEAMRNHVRLVVRSSFSTEDGTHVGGQRASQLPFRPYGIAHQQEEGVTRISVVGEKPLDMREMKKLQKLSFPISWKICEDGSLFSFVPSASVKTVLRVVHTTLGLDAEAFHPVRARAVSR